MEDINARKKQKVSTEDIVNPLRAERVTVRFIPRKGGPDGDRKYHPLFGGMADGAYAKYCVPRLSSGVLKDPLTKNEKAFLEEALGLEYNALSVYKPNNNYWADYYVTVGKEGLTLDLNDPEQYIKYKVLLLNNDEIAPSVEALQDRPRATYRFVLVREADETALENAKMDTTMACYKEFGKIDSDKDTMRTLVELLDVRPYAETTKIDTLRSRINVLIQNDPKAFLRAVTDPMLHTKMLLRRGVEIGKVSRTNDKYYLKADNSPLCDIGEDSTLSIAARWLNLPAHQDIKAILESAVEKARKN